MGYHLWGNYRVKIHFLGLVPGSVMLFAFSLSMESSRTLKRNVKLHYKHFLDGKLLSVWFVKKSYLINSFFIKMSRLIHFGFNFY